MLHDGQEVKDSGTEENDNLESQNMNSEDNEAEHDEEVLEEQLDETATSLPVERPPCVEEANDTGSAHNLANDLAAKRAVKGNDGVLVLGEEGGFDADQGHHSGEAEEKRADDDEDEEGEDANGETSPRSAGSDLLLLEVVKVHEHGYTSGQVQADVWHNSVDGGRDGKSLPVALGRHALPHGLLAGHTDNLVCPDCVYIGEDGTSDGSNDDGPARNEGKGAAEEGRYDASEERVQNVNVVTAEARVATGVSDEVTDGGADGRGDGLLVNEGDGRTGLEERLLLVFLVRRFVGGGRDGDGGHGGLDHADCGNDFIEHVGHLLVSVRVRLVGT
jgi:hypothetical protein